mmetsp:Transcript_10202/g.17183  ORF Transcript_10202/g.17183 Transcript_10202/m.17183 type:complete len:137 (-) Transcript_10202:903-1313(-)
MQESVKKFEQSEKLKNLREQQKAEESTESSGSTSQPEDGPSELEERVSDGSKERERKRSKERDRSLMDGILKLLIFVVIIVQIQFYYAAFVAKPKIMDPQNYALSSFSFIDEYSGQSWSPQSYSQLKGKFTEYSWT